MQGWHCGRVLAAKCLAPYLGHAGGRAMQVVGWSQEGQCVPECCRVQLPPIINLWSFPFGGFDKAVKDFNVEHDVNDSFLRCSEVDLHKRQNRVQIFYSGDIFTQATHLGRPGHSISAMLCSSFFNSQNHLYRMHILLPYHGL